MAHALLITLEKHVRKRQYTTDLINHSNLLVRPSPRRMRVCGVTQGATIQMVLSQEKFSNNIIPSVHLP